MATQKETLRLLCKSIVNRLESKKAIMFPARLRQVVQDELHGLIAPFVLTDEDLKEKVLAKIGAKADMLQESSFTDGDQYKAARAVIHGTFATEELNGFYFQKSPKMVAQTIAQYMMRSSHIDDVFETDDDLEIQIVDVVKSFNPSDAH